MKRVDVKVGFSCNNNCRFCVIADKRRRGDRTTAEIADELEKARREGCIDAVFTGGEVTIRKDLFELVATARRLGFSNIQIQTNGRMLSYRPFCEKLVEAGATEFSPALHGHTPEIHDALTQSPGSFRQTLQGITNLSEMGQRIISNSVITVPNHRFLPELAQLLMDSGVSQFQLAFVHASGNAAKYFDEIVPYKSRTAPFVHQALDLAKERGVPAMVEAFPYCFMAGYEEFCSEPLQYTEDFRKTRMEEGKARGPDCPKCRYYRICEGPWKEYPLRRGWSEFVPVPGERVKSEREILDACKNSAREKRAEC